ncbi:ribosomal protein S18-alanine N-acetyltransferase [Aquihabitans sp. McL0605]|uniref:ribosomal protein S18-alanine N-acetyltransferase n=1 Tax=Aquihabitans sp. McL0605 TaxID=3415671 RepID=UPI003CF03D64
MSTAELAPEVIVAPMRRRHLPDVLAIEAQVYPRPWSSRLFEDELERTNRVYLVARLGPTVVGYAGLLMIADDGHVATIAVDPSWQRRGLARTLLVELVRGAMALGANQLTLEVRMSNKGAQELYRSLGFAPAGARKAYYSDNGEDALVMWAHDIATPEYEARLQGLESLAPGAVVRHGFPAEAGSADGAPHPAIAGGTPSSSTGREAS